MFAKEEVYSEILEELASEMRLDKVKTRDLWHPEDREFFRSLEESLPPIGVVSGKLQSVVTTLSEDQMYYLLGESVIKWTRRGRLADLETRPPVSPAISVGKKLFNRIQREAYELICGSGEIPVEERKKIIESFGIKDEKALIMILTTVLVPYLGISAPIIALVATLISKRLVKAFHETLCEAWQSSFFLDQPSIPTATREEI